MTNHKFHHDHHTTSKGTMVGSFAQRPGSWIANMWPQILSLEWTRTRMTVPQSMVPCGPDGHWGYLGQVDDDYHDHDEDMTGFRVSETALEIEDMGPSICAA